MAYRTPQEEAALAAQIEEIKAEHREQFVVLGAGPIEKLTPEERRARERKANEDNAKLIYSEGLLGTTQDTTRLREEHFAREVEERKAEIEASRSTVYYSKGGD